MAKTRINVGVVGLGRLGGKYAEYCAFQIFNANLVAVSDVMEGVAKTYADKLNVPKWYVNYHDLLGQKNVDAIIVVTPTHLHKPVVEDAAHAGKAIFCEKPLSLVLEDSVAMQQTVEETGIFFQMGFMRRFDPGYVSAKNKLDEGLIGDPILFKSTSRDKSRPNLDYLKPENSGGLFIDMGIHDFDIARWMLGNVKSVTSVGGVLAYPEMKGIGDFDNAITSINFESGALGVIDMSRNGIYGYDIQTEILGTKGSVRIGYLRETPLLVMKDNVIEHDTVPGFYERFEIAYVAQLRNFVNNLVNDRDPPITAGDGVEALRIALAATRSCHEDCRVEID